MHSDFKTLLVEEQGRCFAQLTATDPATEAYEIILGNALRLESIINNATFVDTLSSVVNPARGPEPTHIVDVTPTPIGEFVPPEETPAPTPEPEPAPVEEPKPVKPAPKPAPQLTKQEMVKSLSYYASEAGGNVDVAGMMNAHGWVNLSAVPESQYAALLEEVKQAAGVA